MATGIVPKFEASHLGTACGSPGATARRKDKKDTKDTFLAFLVVLFLVSIWCQTFASMIFTCIIMHHNELSCTVLLPLVVLNFWSVRRTERETVKETGITFWPCTQVEISDVDAELFNELSSSSVMRVDASIRRPPAVLAQAASGFLDASLLPSEWCLHATIRASVISTLSSVSKLVNTDTEGERERERERERETCIYIYIHTIH